MNSARLAGNVDGVVKRLRDHGHMVMVGGVEISVGDVIEHQAAEVIRLTQINAELTAANAALMVRVEEAREVVDNLSSAIMATDQFMDRSLTITGPTGNLKWLIESTDDAIAWLAGGAE